MKSNSFPILIVVFSVALYFLYISPAIGDVKGLVAKKAEYQNILNQAQDLKTKRDAILAQYNNIPQDEIDKLNKIIPDSFDSVVFIDNMNKLATQNGLQIKSIQDSSGNPNSQIAVDPTVTPPPYKTNTVEIVFDGPYDSFTNFLGSVENSLHLVDVQALSISSAGNTNIYEFTLDLAIYSLH